MHPYWCSQQSLNLSYVLRILLGKFNLSLALPSVLDSDVPPRLLFPVGKNLRSKCFTFHPSAAGEHFPHFHTPLSVSHLWTSGIAGSSGFSPSDGKRGLIFLTYVQELFGGRRQIHKLSSHCTCLLGPNSLTCVCSLELSRSWAGRAAGKCSDYSEGRGWAAPV